MKFVNIRLRFYSLNCEHDFLGVKAWVSVSWKTFALCKGKRLPPPENLDHYL